jgi:hypothetical protein
MNKRYCIAASVVGGVLIFAYAVGLSVLAWLDATDTRRFDGPLLLWRLLGSLGVWTVSLVLLVFAIGTLCKRFLLVAAVSLIIAGIGAWAPFTSSALVRQIRDQTRFKLLERVGFAKLRDDAELILKTSPNSRRIAEDDWPESIRRLKPLGVRTNGTGVDIYFFKFVSKESGVFVLPTNSSYEPRNETSAVRYRKVADGLYWYDISA